ncbi:MAG TPA: single-stranded-DNA-specific exonuclease RecJ [Flavobacteriaceae bacterium]|nr:single-stranded-DNA-specific exonuclease RecJ [Flavobacteriaceae bacterium]
MDWKISKQPETEILKELQSNLNIPEFICTLLLQRNIDSLESAQKYFRPNLNELHDPFLMKDMDRTVDRLIQAIDSSEKIMILGDYDVDGTTSVSMLYDYFIKKTLEPIYYIPDRYKEGYGVSEESIAFAADQKVSLIITIDCGIKAHDEIEAANKKGIDVIICDHHIPDDSIPKAYSIINPNQKNCDYPFKGLCGCGIGFKLISAIEKKSGGPEETNQYLDLVAIATIADQMPMINENRTIVHHGLKEFNNNPRPGFHFFIRSINRNIVESDISFNIGPRINASGRMKSGMISVKLMTENDTNAAYKIAQEIESINLLRRSKEKEVTEEAIKKTDPLKFTNVVYGNNWNKGVLGIVASRLVDKFYKPTIVLTLAGKMYTGSARSISNFDIYDAIQSGKEYLDQYGGHKYAAGLSIKEENLKDFIDHFESYVKNTMDNKMFTKTIGYDTEIDLSDINESNFKILSRMSPFGLSNYRPIFRTNNCCGTGNLRLIGKEKTHIKFEISDSKDNKIQALGFNMSEYYQQINNKQHFDILYSISRNTFNNSSSLELTTKAISFK